ncbi:hypothetical protein KTE54_24135 [Burkholderia multivorans]|uniref:hypothetical protein n=1 Tax=Burkholderia multivorans TaxID=87883 RepID=UPI001C25EBF7|nr:hypothetical protein [Burkholderia multivorans]MBU9563772.1 hypothetical protein [Burkholderia multivorans]
MKRLIAAVLAFVSVAACAASTLQPVQLLNPAGSTAGQAIVSTGPTTPPKFGDVVATSLAPISANAVLANATAAAARPTAFTMPSCSTASSAVQWSNGVGFVCNSGLLPSATAAATYAPLASPALTGTPSAPTAAAGTSTTQLATTGFVQNAITGGGNAGAFTTVSASTGIVGVTNGSSAPAGMVGEDGTASGSGVTLTSGAGVNVASRTLAAGQWLITGNIQVSPAAGTTVTFFAGGVSASSGNVGTFPNSIAIYTSAPAGYTQSFPIPVQLVKLAASTTYYLVANITFSGGTATASGNILAIRVR